MKNSIQIAIFCMVGCLLVVLGASIGVAVQAHKITGKPQEFVSFAKVLIGDEVVARTAIEIIESPDLRRRALDRGRALHPNLLESEVGIQVSQAKGSAIFNIRASGGDPKYTRIFLDALLDEYLAFNRDPSPTQTNTFPVKIMDRASGALEDIQDWKPIITIGAVVGGLAGLALSILIASLFHTSGRSGDAE